MGSSGKRVHRLHGFFMILLFMITQVVKLKALITQVLEGWKLPCVSWDTKNSFKFCVESTIVPTKY